ncbi:ABC transporter substrate-binding protein [Cohnella sp. CIP 111063]|uniref:extracellular solute-binding protein n=1 Tax=unclassified Cohnella TaxID=2636738 RepID=UPI000B8C44C4|nr:MULTISPECIES: extracellular solute-binding protein [unclassified Cohnella]OXS60524.1 ABC transporter substrate-binding protein [Cohnella sp. CIP 111063]PRX73236.1 ABC-type glycerol-3-phosphate transport system substrate-binding protein [Cohnella sp. SGD-V74]
MKKLKKPALLILSSVLLLSVILAGCSKKENSNSGASSSPSSSASTPAESSPSASEEAPAGWVFGSEPLAFSAYAHYGWLDFPADMEQVHFWKYLKEHKQTNITAIQAKGNHAQLMTTMMASGDLPDLIYTDRYHPDLNRLYEAGQLVAFDDYLDKYPNLKKYFDKKYLDILRAPDGKLYKFPNWYTDHPTSTAGYVVNKKIYEELGSPPLVTMDDLYNYLVAVKAKYGEDIIPFEPDRTQDAQGIGLIYAGFKEGGLYQSLGASLLAVPEGDKLTSIFTDPAFRESQKFVSKLYREKLISQDMFTQDRGKVQEKILTGRVAIYAGSGVTTWGMQGDMELKKKDPNAGYFMVWPLAKAGLDPKKIYAGGYDALGWNVSVITKSAKDPEKIFAFLDWITGPEGMSVQFFGAPGPDGNWDGLDENGYPNFTANYDPVEVADIQAKNDPVMIAGNSSYIDKAKAKYEDTQPLENQNWAARWQRDITWPSSNDITGFRNNLEPPADGELGDIRQNTLDLFLQILSETATAKSDADVDRILDAAEEKAQKLNYQKLLDWRTERWLENKKILGE